MDNFNNSFNKKIVETINRCSKYHWLVHQNQNIRCTCVNPNTNQPSDSCPICLGLGYKITIRRIKASYNETILGVNRGLKGPEVQNVSRLYFIDKKYILTDNDYIIDNNDLFYIYKIQGMTGMENELTHFECPAALKQNNMTIILKNFYNILKKEGVKF